MRVINKNEIAEVQESAVETFVGSFSQSQVPVAQTSYHELADTPVVQKDALSQLHANIEMLADLQGRLQFVMTEVRYLLKV
ncbi:MAG: hypothetical protein ACKOX6_11510 [Bdellovibrio sp.]